MTGRALGLLLSLLLCAAIAGCPHGPSRRPAPPAPVRLDTPAPLATWPWRKAVIDRPYPGVQHWYDRSSPDGTVLDLFAFDFAANPGLRLELYDQDEDDGTPGDDAVDYWSMGAGQAVRHLNSIGRGRVIAAWNGLFFSNDRSDGARLIARHVAPVVLNGRVRYNVGNHRWTFGVGYRNGAPAFRALFLPDRVTLARRLTFGAGGAQCLLLDGAPLRLQPFPRAGEPAKRGPVPSTEAEAGHIPLVDHMKTSRTSMGWSKDSKKLYVLIVKAPTNETQSALELRHRQPMSGGWMLSDLQAFWRAKGVWGAVNVDGGDVTQLAWRRANGRYGMVPPGWASNERRLTLTPELTGAPEGGTLMYFYVRDARGERRGRRAP